MGGVRQRCEGTGDRGTSSKTERVAVNTINPKTCIYDLFQEQLLAGQGVSLKEKAEPCLGRTLGAKQGFLTVSEKL